VRRNNNDKEHRTVLKSAYFEQNHGSIPCQLTELKEIGPSMIMKQCRICGQEKSLNEFYKQNDMADGHRSECKACTRKNTRLRYITNPNKKREIDRKWYLANKEKRRLITQKWMRANPDKVKSQIGRYSEKVKAKNALNNAIYLGRISKPEICSVCGCTGIIHGHHTDYSKPLEVIWLCPQCHSNVHHDRSQLTNRYMNPPVER
jgi:hypothetical protein